MRGAAPDWIELGRSAPDARNLVRRRPARQMVKQGIVNAPTTRPPRYKAAMWRKGAPRGRRWAVSEVAQHRGRFLAQRREGADQPEQHGCRNGARGRPEGRSREP